MDKRPIIYLVPGTGGDGRLFSKIELTGWDTQILEIPVPEPKETMEQLADRMLAGIDTTRTFALAGVSLGGMVAVELAKKTQPEAVLLISSAKSRDELPGSYRIQKYLQIYRIIPHKAYLKLTNWARPRFEPESKPYDAFFAAMVNDKDPLFIPRALHAIMHWKNEEVPANLYHLHGTNDHTLPEKNIGAADRIEGGSHMMVVTRSKEVSAWMQQVLDGLSGISEEN